MYAGVTGWIEKSIEEGADLILDGRQPTLPDEFSSGHFLGPTIFDRWQRTLIGLIWTDDITSGNRTGRRPLPTSTIVPTM